MTAKTITYLNMIEKEQEIISELRDIIEANKDYLEPEDFGLIFMWIADNDTERLKEEFNISLTIE